MKTSRVDQLISQASAPAPRIKASFNLSKPTFDQFRALCDSKHLNQGELIDALIDDLLARVGAPDGAVPERKKKRGRPRTSDKSLAQ